MSEKTKLGLRILGLALILGVLGDCLLRAIPWGINMSLWTWALAAAVVMLGGWRPEALQGAGVWLVLPIIFFSAAFAWHDSPILKMLNSVAILVGLSLVMLRAQGVRIRLAGLVEYALGSLVAALNAALGLLPLLFSDIHWTETRSQAWSRRSVAVARGVLLAMPLLLLFGGLFAAADAVFEHMIKNTLHLNFYTSLTHFLLTLFLAWIVAGFLRGVLFGNEVALAEAKRSRFASLGITETAIVLGLLDVLFLSFVIVQFRYFFGGAELVQKAAGLTYAEYARRGFFELVAVAALVLPLLLLAHWLLRQDKPGHERIFRLVAGAQILLLLVIMGSAIQRLRLYQQEFGLTELRLYTGAFMGWLAVVFVWFAATVLCGRRKRFAFGALLAGYLLVAALHVLDPDALIARTNTARAMKGRKFDARYAGWLSADAVPALLAALPELNARWVSPNDRRTLAGHILRRWSPAEGADWRTWSLARARALKVVQDKSAFLRAMAGGENGKNKD